MYEVLSHTADVGVAAEGGNLSELFSEAARGMAAVILDADPPQPEAELPVEVAADDLGALLVAFLDECLFRFEADGTLVCGARLEVAPDGSQASGDVLTCGGLDAAGPMIKAVTYHQLAVEQHRDGWRAEVYFDV